jgi:hypothetical protein
MYVRYSNSRYVICIVVDCLALYQNGARTDGVYNITIQGVDHQSPVYCDMTRGGWTVVQRQFDGDVEFQRNYRDYIKGFGNVSGDHWLGLDKIHALTCATSSLRIDFQLYNGTRGYQLYADVSVDTAASGYMLHVTGTSRDLSTLNGPYAPTSSYTNGLYVNNGRQFSTIDHVVGSYGTYCTVTGGKGGGGGWWFNNCGYVNPNAKYGLQSTGGITMSYGSPYHTNPMMSLRRN